MIETVQRIDRTFQTGPPPLRVLPKRGHFGTFRQILLAPLLTVLREYAEILDQCRLDELAGTDYQLRVDDPWDDIDDSLTRSVIAVSTSAYLVCDLPIRSDFGHDLQFSLVNVRVV
mgnify:FL=1|jgi:hypothetical protein